MSTRLARRVSAVSAALAVAVGLAMISTPAGAARRPSAPVPGVASLNEIACPTSTHCVAIGTDTSFNGKAAIVNTANGTTTVWHGTLTAHTLSDVACAVPTVCVGVGTGVTARIHVPSGAASIVTTLHPPSGAIEALGGVACPNTSECFAVGWIGTPGHSKAVVARLSNTGSVLSTVEEASSTGIGDVACPTTSTCLLATANTSKPERIQLLTNGHFGASRALPAKVYVQALGCFQSVVCFALGGKVATTSRTNVLYQISPLTGAVQATHTIGGGFSGDGIACPKATECHISGFSGTRPEVVTVTNGVPGGPRHVGGTSINGLGCTSTFQCFGVGILGAVGFVQKV
jgi:hypothetical protein